MKLAPGVTLGSYEITAILGAGGMGEVYRARDVRLDRDVAIKVLPEFLSPNSTRQRFELEARALAALSHPNILAIYELETEAEVPYIVSELLEGETLRDRLWRGPLGVRKALDYAIQFAKGLAAAHEKGIVHRDLKPENIFLTKNGCLKILDFGLAKIIEPEIVIAGTAADSAHAPTLHTRPGVVLGTSGYMSPEQVRGQPADHRADIFAFGAILREMITGRRTFQKTTPADTMSAILNEEPEEISQVAPAVPAGLERVISRCLEKNPEQRFHSASDLSFALESLSDATLAFPARPAGAVAKPGRRRALIAAASLASLGLAVAGGYWWAKPEPQPKVSGYAQLTYDGTPKTLLGTDGSRLYLGLGAFPFESAAEMATSGGEGRNIPMPSPRAVPVSVSSTGSDLLVVDGEGVPPSGPLWRVPSTGGSPRRLGNTAGATGAWSSDGKMLAFAKGQDVFLATADGDGMRKLASAAGQVNSIVWSPDSRHLRLDTSRTVGEHEFWDLNLEGKSHRVMAGWHDPPDECCGQWSADGKYFLFHSNGQLWALPKPGVLNSQPEPIQLTSSPMTLSWPVPSKDGKKIYAVGQVRRGELMRYEAKSGAWMPFLAAISAEYPAFSRDGQWVTYVTYPEGTLWRSRVDGSARFQLTYPPMYPMLPRWSPDGKQIVFFEFGQGSKPTRMYEIALEGGSPRELMPQDHGDQLDPNFSPDGGKIVFAGNSGSSSSQIRVLDLATHTVSTLPGSQGLFSPRYSPDGQHIGAFSGDSAHLLVFDVQSGQWRELAQGSFGWLNWSKDGQRIYVLEQSGTGAVLQVRLSDGHVEKVIDLKGFKTTGRYRGSLALAPDDSILLLREAGSEDVYVLDWQVP